MTRIAAHLFPVEIALLGLVEMALSFVLICAVLAAPQAIDVPALTSLALSQDCVTLAATFALVMAGTAITIGLYRPEVCLDPRRLLASAGVTAMIAFPAVLLIGGWHNGALTWQEVGWLARVLVVWFVALLLTRALFTLIAARRGLSRRILVLGPRDRSARLCDLVRQRCHGLILPEPAVWNGAPPTYQQLRTQGIWGLVVVSDRDDTSEDRTMPAGQPDGVRIFDEPTFFERHLGQIDLGAMAAHSPADAPGWASAPGLHQPLKRALDIAVALGLLILTLPVMAITALLIKLDSRGPVFYAQQRTGLRGEPFLLFKFRSMVADAEAGGTPLWARHRDSRITRIGSFIRSTRIDELPQLLNVLGGSMSMVGPRPERPLFVDQLQRAIPFYAQRLAVKPGLTGWAQVNFPYGASVEDARQKLAYDLYYVKNRSLALDLVILLRTVRVVLLREGAR